MKQLIFLSLIFVSALVHGQLRTYAPYSLKTASTGAATGIVIEGSSSGTESVNATEHPVTLPSSISVGELLIVFFNADSNEEVIGVNTGASGNNWTEVEETHLSEANTSTIYWKIAEGSDALTITSTGSEMASFIAYRISGINATTPITVPTPVGGYSNAPDPPSVTPANGSQEYLFIVCAQADAGTVCSAAPTNFSDLITISGGATSGAVSSSSAVRLYTTSSAYDPGAFSSATSEEFNTFTVCVNPD